MPKVSVIMPVYNAARYLEQTIESVLNQTFTDFELLAINDCSTDDSVEILTQYADDPRVKVLHNPVNLGIVKTLNHGLDIAHGEYIARMDADDLCLPERFAAQVSYLDAYPEVGLLGTRYYNIDLDGQDVDHGMAMPPHGEPGTRGYIAWKLLWMTSIQHPSAMIRRSVLETHHLRYHEDFYLAEDYELWTRLRRHCVVERLDGAYLKYRVNPAGISGQNRERQLRVHFQITTREVERLLGTAVDTEVLWMLFKVMVPRIQIPDLYPSARYEEAADTLLRIYHRSIKQNRPLPRERRYINAEVGRALKQLLAFARHDRPAANAIRLRLLRHSPLLFTQTTRDFVVYRLKRRLKRSP